MKTYEIQLEDDYAEAVARYGWKTKKKLTDALVSLSRIGMQSIERGDIPPMPFADRRELVVRLNRAERIVTRLWWLMNFVMFGFLLWLAWVILRLLADVH